MATDTTHPPTAAEQTLSVECELAGRPGYEDLHGTCTQLADVPMPGAPAITLVRRCRCACHRTAAR
ncbi:hypothetical protein [Streptomyces sediminimaris]|uniref:hypothetical protein n=1 Tax=Streptomyces sediminimaris TaxID=3383721 RepID=UPI00399A7823